MAILFLPAFKSRCENSASYSLKNKSANNGAHLNANSLLKNLSAKFHENIVDKKFQHFNDIYYRIFCMSIRLVPRRKKIDRREKISKQPLPPPSPTTSTMALALPLSK